MPTRIQRIQAWLGSLPMAVLLLLAIGTVLAWGTIYESRFGTAAVQQTIYQSRWFQALLAFLGLNLAVAAYARYPWRRKHVPFVLAHIGIILILLGGIVGARFGLEGQLLIPEGGASSELALPQKVLSVYEPNPGVHHRFPVHFEARAWVHEPALSLAVPLKDRSLELTVDRYYPNAEMSEAVLGDGTADDPALQVRLSRGEQTAEVWLFAKHPERAALGIGDGHVLFLDAPDDAGLTRLLAEAPAAGRGTVQVQLPGAATPRAVAVPEIFGDPVPIEGTPYTVTFKEYFTDLAVTGEGVRNRSERVDNPAVALTLSGPEGTDPHLLFARHPEFQEVHGITHKIPATLRYVHPAGALLPPQTVAFVRIPTGALAALLTGGTGEREYLQVIEPGTAYRHAWLGYEFTVMAYHPKARMVQQVRNRSNQVKQEAVHVIAREQGQTAEAWVPVGGSADLAVGREPVRVEYRPAEQALPFTVKLLDFRKIDYPGTQMAAGFESDVELTDPGRGLVWLRKISMNQPLRYRGFSLYQASYVPGVPETTILAVRNDPGTPLVYAGFLTVIAGVISLFVFRGRSLAVIAAVLLGLSANAGAAEVSALSPKALNTLRAVVIQHGGRHKPFDSFARETVWQITGRKALRGRHPADTVAQIIAAPEPWQAEPLLDVPFVPLREALGMDPKAAQVSYNDLVATRKLMRMLPAIVEKQEQSEPLSILENETMDLFQRFVAFSNLVEHRLELVPPPSGGVWGPVTDAPGRAPDQRTVVRETWDRWIAALRSGDAGRVEAATEDLAGRLRAANPRAYPIRWRVTLELFYNDAQLFHWARGLYALAFAALLLALTTRMGWAAPVGFVTIWAGFLIHGAGIALRVLLGGRPPVSNFFETMLWLPFVAVLLAIVFETIYPVRYFGLSAALVAAITLVLADYVPLDSSISPVVAVLRSTLWLTIHVLTIVASYGALALATVLAHVYGVIYLVRGAEAPPLRVLSQILYRAIQVGVVLLAGGVMLGAVWANASWGRYWGWDPKETWALITLLWFLATLHGRFAGWVRGVGVALATIGGFFLLLMTYYGVSFYLVGLHSYAGGHAKPLPVLLIGYLIAESTFLAVLGLSAYSRRRLAS